MRKSLWLMLLILPLLSDCSSGSMAGMAKASRNTYNLVGVTLANGATITGQFDWDDSAGSFAFSNVNLVIGGSGAETGFNITTPDTMNNDGLCLSDPPIASDFCGSTSTSSLLLIFALRMTPNGIDTTAAALPSDSICLGVCFKGQQSEVNYADGVSVALTGGSVVQAP